jgi:hypothetical protein
MRYLLIISLLLINLSCEDLALNKNADLVVVEAYLSDQIVEQQITLSRTTSFDNAVISEPIATADVSIVSGKNVLVEFVHSSDGVYLSRQPFAGIENEAYRLIINLEDDILITSAFISMPGKAKIDSLWFEPIEIATNDNEEMYYPVISSSDNFLKNNFYYYRLFQDGVYLDEPENIFLKSDGFFNGNTFNEEFRSVSITRGESVKLEMRKISREVFDYYKLLKAQTISISANQNVVPAPIFGNLSASNSEIVLGFFSVFSSDTKTQTLDK